MRKLTKTKTSSTQQQQFLKQKTMKIDNYDNRYSKQFTKQVELYEVFNNIKYHNISAPKNERKAYVFCSTSNLGRKHENIISFTGLLFIDLDNCNGLHNEMKSLVCGLPYCIACWFSSSGRNVHALIKIPISQTVKEFKSRYSAFKILLNSKLPKGVILDDTASNPTQLAFESTDSNIFLSDNAQIFTEREVITKPPPPKTQTKTSSTSHREQWCIKWIQSRINSIDTNGYPQVLAYCKTLGGYSGAGYISETTAKEIIEQSIKSNTYLNSKDSSGSLKTYLKGGEGSFLSGTSSPIEWQ